MVQRYCEFWYRYQNSQYRCTIGTNYFMYRYLYRNEFGTGTKIHNTDVTPIHISFFTKIYSSRHNCHMCATLNSSRMPLITAISLHFLMGSRSQLTAPHSLSSIFGVTWHTSSEKFTDAYTV